jgi:hypothetical protein
MPLARRALLTASAAILGGLAGCSSGPEPTPTATDSTAGTATPTPSSSPSATDEPDAALRCVAGAHPVDGWPLPDRSVGRTNYAPDADGPADEPTADWSVTVPEPEHGANDFTRPVVAGGRVIVGRAIEVGPERPSPDEHYLHAYDTTSGDEVWHATVAREPNAPAVHGDRVLVDDDSTLYSFDGATGELA